MGFDDASTNAVAFSRGVTSPLAGKRTQPVKTSLTEVEFADFQRARLAAGYLTDADCVRDLIDVFTYGREHLLSLREKQLDLLAGNRSGTGPAADQDGDKK